MHNLPKLLLRADLDNFLAEIVAELVYHYLPEEAAHRIYQVRNEIRRSFFEVFQLLLNHPATRLVICEFFDLANNF